MTNHDEQTDLTKGTEDSKRKNKDIDEILTKIQTLREQVSGDETKETLSQQLQKDLGKTHDILSEVPLKKEVNLEEETSLPEEKDFNKDFIQMNQELKQNSKEKIMPLLQEIDQSTMTPQGETTEQQKEKTADHSFLLQNQAGGSYSRKEKKEKQKSWKKYTSDSETEMSDNQFPIYFYAGFWIRALSFCTDLLCIASLTTIFVKNTFTLLNWNKSELFFSPYILLGLAVYLSYFILLTKFNHGQTIGKMIFGLRVISFKEKKLSWSTVLMREGVCRFILKYPFFMIGYLPAAFTHYKQHMGDFFSDTSVVSINLIKAFRGERV